MRAVVHEAPLRRVHERSFHTWFADVVARRHRLRLALLIALVSGCGDDDQASVAGGIGVLAACAEQGGDRDEDQVCDAEDNCPQRSNSTQADGDRDGVGDECDASPEPCDDAGGDADEDGACDHADNCQRVANEDQRDADDDGLGDACDPANGSDVCAEGGGDDDEDRVCQAADNCLDRANADQRDADRDGTGDACDDTPEPCDGLDGDADHDTICDRVDNCPDLANVTQLDRDVDGIGDSCDPAVEVADSASDPCGGIGGDGDDDSWCGMYDNCPSAANADQTDTDDDELGDACDEEECDAADNDGDGEIDEGMPDTDGDGRVDCADPCPSVADGDGDGDGIGDCADLCPMDPLNDPDRDNVCTSGDNCPLRQAFNQSDRDGDGLGDVCDSEECDGLPNDSDSLIDEGMPDEDEDGVCDAVDSCPGDPLNDADGDGLCHAADSCPDTPNASDTDSDGDGIGNVCDLNQRCEPPVPLLAVGAQPLPVLPGWADMAMSADRQTLYALAGATAIPYASELLAIDMPSRSVKWRMVLGGSPSLITLSSDGTRAWVILSGARSVRMIDLVARRRCGDFAAWSDTRQLLQPSSMTPIPGRPGSLIVHAEGSYVRVFDEGLPRMKGLTGLNYYPYAAYTVAADEDTVYASNGSTLQVHTLGPTGFESVTSYAGVIDQQPMRLIDGRLYTQGGVIVDPIAPRRLADLPAQGTFEVDVARAEIYYMRSPGYPFSDQTQVDIWDARTFAYKATIIRPTMPRVGGVKRLLRWGASGLLVVFAPYSSTGADELWFIDNVEAGRQ